MKRKPRAVTITTDLTNCPIVWSEPSQKRRVIVVVDVVESVRLMQADEAEGFDRWRCFVHEARACEHKRSPSVISTKLMKLRNIRWMFLGAREDAVEALEAPDIAWQQKAPSRAPACCHPSLSGCDAP